jgi:preprotein translocase subunit SecA
MRSDTALSLPGLRRHWRDARAVFAQPGRTGAAAIGAEVALARAAMARHETLDDHALLARGMACRAALTRATLLAGGGTGGNGSIGGRAEALALVALNAGRQLGMVPNDAQLFAALAMHDGFAVDLPAGGGKTLAVACCAILHAWSGTPCHVIVASERLAQRDAHALGRLFAMADCSVGWLAPDAPRERLADLYACDILYATGRQLMTEHVRAGVAAGDAASPLRRQLQSLGGAVQPRGPAAPAMRAAVVDDVDRVLLDEALTPLLISAGGDDAILEAASRAACGLIAELVPQRDYTVAFLPMADVVFTEQGQARLDALRVRLPAFWRSPARSEELVVNALIAREVLIEDRHYAVREGRVMPLADNLQTLLGNRGWYAGILQALETRAGVALTPPPRTIARTALQEFFPLYRSLSGAGALLRDLGPELWRFYGLRTLAPPPAAGQARRLRPARATWRREVFATRHDKIAALLACATRLQQQGLPVLVCAADATDLQAIAVAMAEARLTAQVAVGMDPEQDALRLGQAGQAGALTLATSAALRGTPIPVSARIRADGGLQVLSSGYQESRRLDHLVSSKGSTPGEQVAAQFFVSVEDDMFSRNLPFWAAPLQWAARRSAMRAGLLPWLARRAQARMRKQLARHRELLLKREQQLDQQLAFSRRG